MNDPLETVNITETGIPDDAVNAYFANVLCLMNIHYFIGQQKKGLEKGD